MTFITKQPAFFLILLVFALSPVLSKANEKPFVTGERDIIMKITYRISVKGHLDAMRLKIVIPQSIKNRQTINDISFSQEPDSFYTKDRNNYALFKLYDVEESVKISMKCKVTIYKFIDSSNHDNDSSYLKYILPEPFIQSESASIKKVADSLKQKTDIETVMKTYFYVKDHISYQRNEAIGADSVLETGVGKCMDFSDLFNALLRANKIPAKSMYGIVVEEDADWPYHAWSEVYLKKQGWILFDPTSGHTDITLDGKNFKMRIANKYILTSEGRNEPELHVKLCNIRYKAKEGNYAKLKVRIETEQD